MIADLEGLTVRRGPGAREEKWQCALDLAANRASKIRKLYAAGVCDLADQFRESLDADVEAFIEKFQDGQPPLFAAALREL